MSLSTQKESLSPKLPAAMMVKVLGTNRSVRGRYPTASGCLLLYVAKPEYRKPMGIVPGISPGYTALGKASFWAFAPSITGASFTNVSSSLGNLNPFFLKASPKSFSSGKLLWHVVHDV